MQEEIRAIDLPVVVPAPVRCGDSDAWFTPAVQRQYAVAGPTVITIRQADDGPVYSWREPFLDEQCRELLQRYLGHVTDRHRSLAPTRECVRDRLTAGLPAVYAAVLEPLVDDAPPPAHRRRLTYYVHSRVRGLDAVTPVAADGRVTAVRWEGSTPTVRLGTGEPIPIEHSLATLPAPAKDRITHERYRRHTVSFLEFTIPVEVGRSPIPDERGFRRVYRPCEPPLLPGDRSILQTAADRLWDSVQLRAAGTAGPETATPPSRRAIETAIRERADAVLGDLTAGTGSSFWEQCRSLFGRPASDGDDHAQASGPDRRRRLRYYLLRDTIGFERLTVPICDGWLEDIEVNGVADRVKVLARDGTGRIVTPIRFETEHELEGVVVQMASQDGVELTASTPSAKVNLTPPGDTEETIRCGVALGAISEHGPHLSIRKQRPEPLGPVELVTNGTLPVSLVALLWIVFEHHGIVLFCGRTGVGKTTLMNAHLPFIPRRDRPISIDEGSREVRLPHETGVSLRTRAHPDPDKRVTMAELMTQANYLNPDVEIIAELNSPESFATFGEVIATGHGVVGTTHAQTVERLANRFVEQDLGIHLLAAIDLLVFPRHVAGDRFVGTVCTPYRSDETAATPTITRNETTIGYETLIERTPAGEFVLRSDPDSRSPFDRVFSGLTDRTGIAPETIAAAYHERREQVDSLIADDITGVSALSEEISTVRREYSASQ